MKCGRLVLAMLARKSRIGEHCKMDDADYAIRQYVAALSRLHLDFDGGEFGRCDDGRVDIGPI
jgi:hypothetical protein